MIGFTTSAKEELIGMNDYEKVGKAIDRLLASDKFRKAILAPDNFNPDGTPFDRPTVIRSPRLTVSFILLKTVLRKITKRIFGR